MTLGLLALFIASAVGGLNPVVLKIGLRELPPLTLIALRFFLATCILLPFIYKKLRHLSKRDIAKLTIVSSLFTLNVALFTTGIGNTTVIMSQILSMISPIVVGIFAIFIVKEHMQKENIIGVGIAMIGVIFLMTQSYNGAGNTFGTPFGNMLVFLSMIFWCLYITLSRRLIRRYSPMTVSFFTMAVSGAVLLTVAAPIELYFHAVDLSTLTISTAGSLTYLVFIATLFFFPMMQYGIKHTNAFTASLTSYISPVFGGGVAVLFMGEKITQPFIIGTVFILLGVLYSTNIKYLKKYLPAMLE